MTGQGVADPELATLTGVEWWAVQTHHLPTAEHSRRGCPATGWLHEGRPPYRVIVARDPFLLPRYGEILPYAGDEKTVTVAQWLAGR